MTAYSTELLSGIVGKALVNGHGCHGIEGAVRCIASQVLIIRLSADHGSIVAAQRKRRQTQPQTPLFTFRCEHGPELAVGRDTAGYNDRLASGMLLGMAAGAALGAVGVMAATQNQRQLRRTTRKVMKGAENAVLQLDRMVGDFVEKHMDS